MDIIKEYQRVCQCLLKINQSIELNGAMSPKDFREILEECGLRKMPSKQETNQK